jgi:phospholipid/cholesterol/gamma-HCH transport system substrate-binding protein
MALRRATELKVGLMVLLSAALLVAFFLILGNVRLSRDFQVFVDFNNTMGMRAGAAIRLSGISCGKVSNIVFHPPATVDGVGRAAFARVELALDPALAGSIRADSATFAITTKGMLGEPYVEIDPGLGDGAPIAEGAVLAGQEAFSQTAVFSNAGSVLKDLRQVTQEKREDIQRAITAAATLLENAAAISADLRRELPDTMQKARLALDNANTALEGATELETSLALALGDGSELAQMKDNAASLLVNLDETSAQLGDEALATLGSARGLLDDSREDLLGSARELRALLAESRGAVQQLRQTLEPLGLAARGTPDLVDKLSRTVGGLESATPGLLAFSQDLPQVTGSALRLLAALETGKGSLGALMMDRTLYDDLRELVLEIKRRPWKVLRKE